AHHADDRRTAQAVECDSVAESGWATLHSAARVGRSAAVEGDAERGARRVARAVGVGLVERHELLGVLVSAGDACRAAVEDDDALALEQHAEAAALVQLDQRLPAQRTEDEQPIAAARSVAGEADLPEVVDDLARLVLGENLP